MGKNITEIALIKLIEAREAIVKIREDSWNETAGEYDTPKDDELDENAKDIMSLMSLSADLPVDLVLEAASSMGAAPCLINDDNGHWAISTSGFQQVMTGPDPPQDVQGFQVMVDPGAWHDNIKDAVDNFIKESYGGEK